MFYNLEINVRTLIRITICHGCQSVNPGPHLSACTLLKWTNYRSTSDTLVRRGVIPNLALVIGTCAFLHSHWSIAGFEPRSTVPVQSVVPSLTLIVPNDWWFIVVYVIYQLPAVYFGLFAAIHLKSHLQLPLLSNKNKRSGKLLHGMHCVCGYSSFR